MLNYAAYLEEHNCFEEAFRVSAKRVGALAAPASREICQQHLNHVEARYKGSKIERARDIFEKVATRRGSEA